jgi:hypothetical protein
MSMAGDRAGIVPYEVDMKPAKGGGGFPYKRSMKTG